MPDDFDAFSTRSTGLNSPAENAETITPSDSTDLSYATRAIYVATDGDIRATFLGGTTVTLSGLRGGAAYPFRLQRILSTGTTATGIIGLR